MKRLSEYCENEILGLKIKENGFYTNIQLVYFKELLTDNNILIKIGENSKYFVADVNDLVLDLNTTEKIIKIRAELQEKYKELANLKSKLHIFIDECM